MRIVVDTNVFVSACIGAGAASKVIEACLRGEIDAVMGSSLLNEYRDVLSRDHMFAKARLNEDERNLLFDAFLSRCQWQPIFFKWRPNLADEGDNHVFELAIAANAAMIVTGNIRDFHRAELKFPSIKIVRPEAVVENWSQ